MGTHNIAFGNDPAPCLEPKEKHKSPCRGHCRLLICCQVCRERWGRWPGPSQGLPWHSLPCQPVLSGGCSVLSGSRGASSLLLARVLLPGAALQRRPPCSLCGLRVHQGVNGPFTKCYSCPRTGEETWRHAGGDLSEFQPDVQEPEAPSG